MVPQFYIWSNSTTFCRKDSLTSNCERWVQSLRERPVVYATPDRRKLFWHRATDNRVCLCFTSLILANDVKLGKYTIPTGNRSPGRRVAVHYATAAPRKRIFMSTNTTYIILKDKNALQHVEVGRLVGCLLRPIDSEIISRCTPFTVHCEIREARFL